MFDVFLRYKYFKFELTKSKNIVHCFCFRFFFYSKLFNASNGELNQSMNLLFYSYYTPPESYLKN